MKVTPKSEAEIEKEQAERAAAWQPLPPGVYDFDVVSAEDKRSKAGNEMIEIELKVFDSSGGFRKISDWLLDAMAHKVRHFCESTGLLAAYEAGNFESYDCLNRSGKVQLGIQKGQVRPGFEGQPRSSETHYPDRNNVQDYVADPAAAPKVRTDRKREPVAAGGNADPFDDEIPFACEWR